MGKRFTAKQKLQAVKQHENGTPTKKISEKLGVSRNSIYTWARNKDDLLAAVADETPAPEVVEAVVAVANAPVAPKAKGQITHQERDYLLSAVEGLTRKVAILEKMNNMLVSEITKG